MNCYEMKQQARRERLENASERASERARAAFARGDMSEAATGIPFGQPILVGHHSEGRHRRVIARADAAMRKGCAEHDLAKALKQKADAVGKGGISSDDPDAIKKLKAKIADAEKAQALMIAGNKALRKTLKKHDADTPEALAMLTELLDDEGAKHAASLMTPDFCGRRGFASYMTTNNNANIRRMKLRVEQLEKASRRETKETEFQGFTVIENADENRVQFIFEGKPSPEIRAIMKNNGFRWAPSQNAWQRQLTNSGIYSAKRAIKSIKGVNDEKI